jgi:hypothetical protein
MNHNDFHIADKLRYDLIITMCKDIKFEITKTKLYVD